MSNEGDIARATEDAVSFVKGQGVSVDAQPKVFLQFFSGQLDMLARSGNEAAEVMHDAISSSLLGRSSE